LWCGGGDGWDGSFSGCDGGGDVRIVVVVEVMAGMVVLLVVMVEVM